MTARYRARAGRHEILLIEIGEDKAGQPLFEVERNRRPLLHVAATEDYARAHIRRVRLPDEKVYLVDKSGHRTDITKDFQRGRQKA